MVAMRRHRLPEMETPISLIFVRDRSVMITNDCIAKLTDVANFQGYDLVHTLACETLPGPNVAEPHRNGFLPSSAAFRLSAGRG